jgi:hypothetical protein
MEVQSTSMKTAQPVFPGDVAKAAFTLIAAVALVAGLIAASVLVLSRPGSTGAAVSTVEQALIDHRAGERDAFVASREAAALEQALIDHRAGERQPLDGRSQAAIDADAERWQGLAEYYGFGDGASGSGGSVRGNIPQ